MHPPGFVGAVHKLLGRGIGLDRLTLNGMLFYGTHGVHEEEARLGQRFEVDTDMYLDTAKAGASDSLADTVNYGEAYETIRDVITQRRYHLIEALAAAVARELLHRYPLVAVTVRLRKPHAPIRGVLNDVEIEIHRKREWLLGQE